MPENNPYDSLVSQDTPAPQASAPAPEQAQENVYQSIADEDVSAQQSALQSSMFVAAQSDPDRHAKILDLAGKTNLPADIVDKHFDDLSKKYAVDSQDYAAIVKETPRTAEWLQDPNNAAVARDEIPAIRKMEHFVNEFGVAGEVYAAIGRGSSRMMESIAQTPALVWDAGYIPGNILAGAIGRPDLIATAPEIVKENFFTRHFRDQAEYYSSLEDNKSISEAIENGEYGRAGKLAMLQIAQNSPNIALILGATMVGMPMQGLVAMGLTTAASANIKDQKAKPKLNPGIVTAGAVGKGFIEAGAESIGTLGLFKGWSKAIFNKYGAGVTTEIMKDLSKAMIHSMAGEATEEYITSVAQDLTDWVSGVNPKALTGIWRRATDSAIVGGLSGLGLTAPAAVGAGLSRQQQGVRTEQTKEFYTALGAEAEAMKLHERMPEAQRKLVETITKDGPVENIHISADAVKTYFQEKGESPEAFMDSVGALKQYNEAVETGSDVQIKTSDWIAKVVGTEHYAGLANDIKFNPEGLSVNEFQLMQENLKKDLEAQVEAAKPVDAESPAPTQNAILDQVSAQLVESGFDKKTADTYAKLHQSAFQTLGSISGIDPMELFNKYGLRIRSEDKASPAAVGETSLQQDTLNNGGTQGNGGGDGTGAGTGQRGSSGQETNAGALRGLPASSPGPSVEVRKTAEEYARRTGIPYSRSKNYVKADPERGSRIAAEYDKLKNNPDDPEVKAAYRALIDETLNQYQILKETGLVIEAIEPGMANPYPEGSKQMMEDVASGHLWFFPTDQGFGTLNTEQTHPLLEPTNEKIGDRPLLANDVFRIVHDVFGHAKEGNGFGPNGEENAWQIHVRMYSPLAARAMTTETRGQNSWVNFGPHGEQNRSDAKNTVYADQKAGLLPEWVMTEGFEFDIELEQSAANSLGFYSKLQRTIEEKLGPSATVEQVNALLRDTKAEERKWSGIDEFLKGKEKVSKAELLEFLAANQLQVKEVTKKDFNTEDARGEYHTEEDVNDHSTPIVLKDWTGREIDRFQTEEDADEYLRSLVNEQGATKFENYTLPGGENYREVLFTLPGKSDDALRVEYANLTLEANALDTKGAEHSLNPQGYARLSEIAARKAEIRKLDAERTTFKSGHWDEPNVLAHVRLDDRTDADGKKVLFVEEIQSDWHQAGRKKGYSGGSTDKLEERLSEVEGEITDIKAKARDAAIEAVPEGDQWVPKYKELIEQSGEKLDALSAEQSELVRAINESHGGVPDAPFKKTWHEFALKRIIRMAAEGGYDRVAWTTGEQQAERYDLSQHVGSIDYKAQDDGTYKVEVFDNEEIQIKSVSRVYSKDQIEGTFGKGIAEKILAGDESDKSGDNVPMTKGWKRIRGLDLKVGGEGMKGFYDKILVDFANKFGKKFGAKVGGTKLGTASEEAIYEIRGRAGQAATNPIRIVNTHNAQTEDYFDTMEEARDALKEYNGGDAISKVHSLDLTEAIKEAALKEGFSLFQEGGEGPRGRIRFSAGSRQFNIDLLKDADLSTFLHETGHFFLEILGDLATTEGAKDSLKGDFQTILDWLGVKTREEIGREQHEQFARGFEAYLAEGKAPTSALQSAFSRFRVWLISIYRNLKNLNVSLTPEVRSVMDRLLATQTEIDAARNAQGFTPLFDDPSKFGLTGKKAEAYQNAVVAARAAAEEQLTSKIIAEHNRQLEIWWREERAKVEEQVAADVNKQPVYIADSVMRRGKMPDGSALPPGVSGVKLSRKSLRQSFPAELVKKVPRGTASEDGMHHDVVANLFGFRNGTELVTQLAAAEPRENLIQRLTDEKMKALHGDLLTDGRIKEEALKAVHTDQQAELMRLELEHLASQDLPVLKDVIRKVARRVPTQKEVRAQAEKIVNLRSVSELRPELYRRAEAKAAKEAGEFLTKGDLEKAYEAKRRELLNHELYRATVDAKEAVEKAVQKFKRIAKPDADLAKTRDIDLVNAARAVLAAHGLGKTDATPDSYLEKIKRYDPDTYEVMASLVRASTERASDYYSVPYEQFQVMANAVNALWELSRSSREMEIDGKKVDREEVIAKLGDGISERVKPGPRAGYDRAATKWDRTKMYLLGGRSALRRVESWVDSIDGGDPNGAFRKYLWNPVHDGVVKYRLAKEDYMRRYLEIVKTVRETLTFESISAPELGTGYDFSGRAELIGAILHSGNNSNLSKLLRGRGWGSVDANGELIRDQWDKFISRMIAEGKLTKADYDFAQKIWDLMEELKPQAQRAHKQMYGHYFSEVTADAIETPWGVYRGGYVPAKADPFVAQDAAIRNEKESLERQNNSFAFPTSGRGATKTRVDEYAAPLQLDIRFVPSHIDWALRFVHIEPAVKDAGKLLWNKGFRNQLDALDPTVAGDMLVPWLQRTAQQIIETPGKGWFGKGGDVLWRAVRKNSGLQVMAANVTNALQQYTGLSIAALKVKPRFLRDALWNYGRAPKDTAEAMVEKSEFMRTRSATQLFEIQNELDDLLLNPTKYENAKKWAQQNGYILQAMAQNMVDTVVWTGAYDQAVENGAEEKAAVREADSAVRLTQGSFNAEDISRFETGTPFSRAFKMFYGYFNMQANFLGTEFEKTIRELGLKKSASRGLMIYTLGFMIPAVLSELITKAMSGKLDADDDGQYLDDLFGVFFGAQLRTATAFLPVVGQVLNAGISAANNKWYDDKISTSPAIAMIESATVGNVKNIKAVATGKEVSGKKIVKDALTALGLLSGLPLAPIAKPIGYGLDVSEGKARPKGPVDFARGLVTGKSGG